MPLILMCDICRDPYRASDLSTVRVDPPHYQDLPEPSAENYVDQNDRGDRFIYLHYCELCLDELELPPVKPVSDPDLAPDPYHLGDDVRTDGGAAQIRFADEHVDAILDGEKTVTFRYEFEHDFDVGERIELVNQNGRLVTDARVVTQFEIVASEIPATDFAGHTSYDHVDELFDELREYYPDAPFTLTTPLDVVVFSIGRRLAGGDA